VKNIFYLIFLDGQKIILLTIVFWYHWPKVVDRPVQRSQGANHWKRATKHMWCVNVFL